MNQILTLSPSQLPRLQEIYAELGQIRWSKNFVEEEVCKVVNSSDPKRWDDPALVENITRLVDYCNEFAGYKEISDFKSGQGQWGWLRHLWRFTSDQ